MIISYDKIEEVQASLPPANEFEGYYIFKDVTDNGIRVEVKFYKAKTGKDEQYFWICNPYKCVPYKDR